jgi:hypothetical protein
MTMPRKMIVLAMAVLIGAATAGGISSASTRIAASAEIDTIETHKVQHTIDVGNPGMSVGDVIVISTDLSTPDGSAKLGHQHEVCTVIHPSSDKLSFLCSATAEFTDGQVSSTGEFPTTDPDHSYSITGGTGAYEGVGGMVVITPTAASLELDFHLVP